MNINIDIDSITIITGHSVDKIYLNTAFPEAIWPYSNREKLSMSFEATASQGKEFCNKHFPGLPIEVIHRP